MVGIALWGVLASSLAAALVRPRRRGKTEDIAGLQEQLDRVLELLDRLEERMARGVVVAATKAWMSPTNSSGKTACWKA